MNDIFSIPKAIIETRKAQGLSQVALAQKLGMKQSQISEIEAGKRDFRVSTLSEVARALGLEIILVPRQLLPAVSYVIEPKITSGHQESKYESWNEEEGAKFVV